MPKASLDGNADWRPRERLIREGPTALSDRELLAVILGTGIRGKNVHALSDELLRKIDATSGVPDAVSLSRMEGLGEAKATAISAMMEFGRRRWGSSGQRINGPEDVYPMIRHFADRRQERFICLSLNGAHEVLAIRLVTMGTVNRTLVHPREVYAEPLMDRANAILVAHNHPSGRLEPSAEDQEITRRLVSTGDILGIPILDHLIITERGYYSFMQNGNLAAT